MIEQKYLIQFKLYSGEHLEISLIASNTEEAIEKAKELFAKRIKEGYGLESFMLLKLIYEEGRI